MNVYEILSAGFQCLDAQFEHDLVSYIGALMNSVGLDGSVSSHAR